MKRDEMNFTFKPPEPKVDTSAPRERPKAVEFIATKAEPRQPKVFEVVSREESEERARRSALLSEAITSAIEWRDQFGDVQEMRPICEAIARVVDEIDAAE